MVKFTFEGFAEGADVAVSVTQDAVTRAASVPSWRQGLATIAITADAQASEAVAPFGVRLKATGHADFDVNGPDAAGIDRTHTGFYYKWTLEKSNGAGGWISDPLSFRDTAGVLNIPTVWRDRCTMFGPSANFVLEDGDWRVTLFAYEVASGKTATTTWEKTVAHPDDAYPTTRTAVVSFASDWTGEPTGATRITDEAGLNAFIGGTLQSQTGRILFKRGETFEFENFILFTGAQNIRLGAYGTISGDNRPICGVSKQASRYGNYVFIGNNGSANGDMVLQSIRAAEGWDQAREAGRRQNLWAANAFSTTPFVLHDDVEIRGCDLSYAPIGGGSVGTGFIHDSYVHDWSEGYGVYPYGEAIAVVGSSLMFNPNGCIGPAAEGLAFANHGMPMRGALFGEMDIAASYGFNTGGHGGANIASGAGGGQPVFRTDNAMTVNFDRVVTEGGYISIEQYAGKDGEALPRGVDNSVFDKILMVPGMYGTGIGLWRESGATIRNAIFASLSGNQVVAKTPILARFRPHDVIDVDALDQPAEVYNSTIYNLNANGGASLTALLSSPDTTKLIANSNFENNILQDAAGGSADDAPLDLSTAIPGFVPQTVGLRFSVQKPTATPGTVSGSGGTFTVSYPTQAYRDGSGVEQSRTLTAADIEDTDIHAVYDSGNDNFWYVSEGEVAIDTSDPSLITITNNSGTDWSGTITVNIVPKATSDVAQTNTRYALPGSAPTGAPQTGSGALGDAADVFIAHDSALAPGVKRISPDRGAVEG